MNPFNFRKSWSLAFLIAGLLGNAAAWADVKPAALFGDHMVLQQGMSVPVWGWADPGEKVTVTLNGQTQTATAGEDRKWMVRLTDLKEGPATTMTLAGKNSITFNDVLIGEVWLGSGQSNMEFSLSKSVKRFAGVVDEEKEIAAADYPNIRMFTVKMAVSDKTLDDCTGQWQVCTPANAPAFSAVGYYFSRSLQKAINRPIGFINTSYGASVAQAWISKQDMEANKDFAGLMSDLEKQKAAYAAVSTTQPTTEPARGAKGPTNPINNHSPCMLWNAMLHPVQPYAIRGVLWYQGESIIGGTELYSELMETLITTWRKQWGQGDFPFYFVQLAALDKDSNKPEVREAQAKALLVNNTAMATAIDIGDKKNVHPKNKQELGDRLAKIARALVYGEKIEFSGPVYDSMKIEGDAIRIKFTHVGGGLLAKGGELKTFTIAGADKKFIPATAKIEGDSILVTGVASPVAVRYAWNRWPEGCNLYNTDGLPAPPFRTDGQ